MTEKPSAETEDATEEPSDSDDLVGCQSSAEMSVVMILVVLMLSAVACIVPKRKEN